MDYRIDRAMVEQGMGDSFQDTAEFVHVDGMRVPRDAGVENQAFHNAAVSNVLYTPGMPEALEKLVLVHSELKKGEVMSVDKLREVRRGIDCEELFRRLKLAGLMSDKLAHIPTSWEQLEALEDAGKVPMLYPDQIVTQSGHRAKAQQSQQRSNQGRKTTYVSPFAKKGGDDQSK